MIPGGRHLQRLRVEFGITGATRDWIASYLRSRSFFVRIGQSSSSICSSNAGVPQGSVLGPVLFTVYVSSSIVSSRVLASTTTATLTILNYTKHSKVTWDRFSINCRSAPLHCSTGSGSTLYCSIQTSQTSPSMERGRV